MFSSALVCLLAGLHKNYSTDFTKFGGKDRIVVVVNPDNATVYRVGQKTGATLFNGL